MIVAATDTDFGSHAFWLASRASGVVAVAMLTFTVIVGLSIGGRLPFGIKARDLTRIHEFCSLAAIVAIVAHGALLIGDPWLAPTVTQLVVPFQLEYETIYTGLGIVAGWITVLLGLSYYIRDQIGLKRWKTIHRFTIVGYAMSVVHVLGSGTDASEAWLMWPLLISTGVVAVLFAIRMRGAKGGTSPQRPDGQSLRPSSSHHPRPPAQPTPAHPVHR